jgi:hypothetical protein
MSFILRSLQTMNVTIDAITLEPGHEAEVSSLSQNAWLAYNQGLISIEEEADLIPGTRINNPNGQDLVLTSFNIDEATGGSEAGGVALTMPNIFAVAGSPVNGVGTLAVSLVSQPANKFLASPVGASGAPVMRGIDPTDLPLAGTAAVGAVKKIPHIAQLVAAPTQGDFNGLLTALTNAGIMA